MLGNPEQTSPSEGLVGRKMKHFVRAMGKAEGRERELAWWDRGKRHWRTEGSRDEGLEVGQTLRVQLWGRDQI